MERSEITRARALLVTSAQSASSWAIGRVSHWVLLARARLDSQLGSQLSSQVPPHVQRFGKNLWQRITTRWPGLADLLSEVSAAHAPTHGFTKPVQVATAELSATEDVAALIAELRAPSAELAAIAAIKLGARSEPDATNALRDVLRNAEGYFNPLTRVAALQAFTHTLTKEPSPEALEPLIELVRDVDAEVSMAAIDALAQRAPSNIAIERLLPIVRDDTGYFLPIVRSAASRALERAGLLTTASA